MIKFLFKSVFGCLTTAIVAIVILLVVGVWFALQSVRPAVETAITTTTGFETTIGEMDISPFSLKMDSHDFVVNNPGKYADNRFVNFRRVMFDLGGMPKPGKELVVEEAVIDIAYIGYVESQEEGVRANAFEFADKVNALLIDDSAAEESSQEPSGEPAEPTPFLIKKMTFRLDDVYWVKGANGDNVKTFNANVDMTFTDVSDVNQIVEPLRKELAARGLGFLITGLLPDILQGLGSGVIGNVEGLSELTGELGGRAAEIGGRAAEVGSEVVGEGAKQAGEAVKGIFGRLKKDGDSEE